MKRRLIHLAAGISIGAIVAGGVSYAAIPNGRTKQITACILKAGADKGATRIIDAQRGATCKTTETKIEWSATGVNWRGNWASAAIYETNDAVYYQGSTYRARQANTSIAPGTSGADWSYLARAGATGPIGPAGADGQDATLDRPGHTATSVDDPVQPVEFYSAIAIGTDGLAVIAHRDADANGLRVSHCDNIACTTATSTTVDDPANSVGSYTSITIGTDGLAIISHQDFNVQGLRVTHCDDQVCSSGTSTTIDDVVDNVGAYTSVAIGADGLPLVSHTNSSANGVRVTHCATVSCTSATSTTDDVPGAVSGSYTSLALGADLLPIISFAEGGNRLRVVHCSNRFCLPYHRAR